METEFKIGDWVEVDSYKGYYEIIGFSDYYSDDDDDEYGYKRGTYENTLALLKLVFTSTMKLKLALEFF